MTQKLVAYVLAKEDISRRTAQHVQQLSNQTPTARNASTVSKTSLIAVGRALWLIAAVPLTLTASQDSTAPTLHVAVLA